MTDLTWIEIIAGVLALAFAAYIIFAMNWRDQQIGALITLNEAIYNRLAKLEDIERLADRIEGHTGRTAEPLYDQDRWERENPYP